MRGVCLIMQRLMRRLPPRRQASAHDLAPKWQRLTLNLEPIATPYRAISLQIVHR